MGFNLTVAQQNAVTASSGTLVAAAAGSGKTAVLARRVVNLLCGENPVPADRLLVVTFMNEAAEEMRSRIEKLLEEECRLNPDNRFLIKQKFLLRNASICTIDSFCISLIREHFDVLGISPDFKIGDNASVEKIRQMALNDIFSHEFEQGDSRFKMLLDSVCTRFDETELKQIVEEIYYKCQSMPFPEEWLDDVISKNSSDDFFADNVIRAFEVARERILCAVEFEKTALKLISGDDEIKNTYEAVLKCDIELFNDVLKTAESADWDSFYIRLNDATFQRMPTNRKISGNNTVDAVKQLRDDAKKILVSLKSLFYTDFEDALNDYKKHSVLVVKLLGLVKEFSIRFRELCANAGVMTFSDAEHYALKLLCENIDGEIIIKDTANTIIGRYDEVLVDEFQDINDLQDILFSIISNGGRNLFCVGDVKQSIYRFRGSNPDIFLKKKRKCRDFVEGDNEPDKKIILSNNFRSRDGICHYVNFLFSILMDTGSSIQYNSEEVLNPSADFPENPNNNDVEIHMVSAQDCKDSDTVIEADYIARYISELCHKPILTDKTTGEFRCPKFSDFAVLMRSVKNNGHIFSEQFAKWGIPVTFDAEEILESSEVKIILALLTIISNPTKDIELVSVMMSPIFNFSAEEMALIRTVKKSGNMVSAVIAAANSGDKKCIGFLDCIDRFRESASVKSVGSLVDDIYSETGFLNKVTALSDGKVRRNNLSVFLSIAYEYESSNPAGSIMSFIRYVNKLDDKSLKIGHTGANDDSVKILTIHKSKGLQYPICILAGTNNTFGAGEARSNISFNSNFGVAMNYFDPESNNNKSSLPMRLLRKIIYNEDCEEEKRLAYVAMTRAEERLVVVCVDKNNFDGIKCYSEISSACADIGDYRKFILEGKSYKDWIVSCAVTHPDFKSFGDSRYIYNSDGHVKFIFTDYVHGLSIQNHNTESVAPVCNKEIANSIGNNLRYKYPYYELKNIESKSSVSVIAHKADKNDFEFTSKPSFMFKEGLSPTDKGTATHKFMQFADFSAAERDVEYEIERIYEWEYITSSEKDAISTDQIKKFFETNIYQRMKCANSIEREMRFLTEMPAGVIYPDVSKELFNEPIIVQGAVDCVFEEKEGIVVLDFKTDRVKSQDSLISAYAEQLRIYGSACMKIFSKPIKQLVIYSFHLNGEINIPIK